MYKNDDSNIISKYDELKVVLKKLEQSVHKVLIVIDNDSKLVGTISDGDVRRGYLKSESSIKIAMDVCNQTPIICPQEDIQNFDKNTLNRIKVLPVVDNSNTLVGYRQALMGQLEINDKLIGQGSPCYIIAEIGNNHNGSLANAKKLVDAAKAAGVDCVKFQIRDLVDLYGKAASSKSIDLGVEYTLDLLAKTELTLDEHFELKNYVDECGLDYLCTPWDRTSADVLQDFGVSFFKLASADFTNFNLISHIAKFQKPMILSTGMSNRADLEFTFQILSDVGAKYAMLHCNSAYPAPFEDVHLNWMKMLSQYSGIVGYSGHERGIAVTLAAVALGAQIVERHITLDKNMEGPDHKASLDVKEFELLCKGIREIELSLSLDGERKLSQGEMLNREVLGKSLVAANDIKIGDVFSYENLDLKSPGNGLKPPRVKDIIGKRAYRNLKPGSQLDITDIQGYNQKMRRYDIPIKYGIPVRFHDFQAFAALCDFDLYEFHFSYKDLDYDISSIDFAPAKSKNLVVHAPELFENDFVLDLASEDEEKREYSVKLMNKVIDVTLRLSEKFSSVSTVPIITNVGGYSLNSFINNTKKQQLYDNVSLALEKLSDNHVEIIIQTMPPFPWHFGGQRFHNLFVNPEETINFCDINEVRLCLDISHTYLAALHENFEFYGAIDKLLPHTRHLHLADARSPNGEGLQFGHGDIELNAIGALLRKQQNIELTCIPEIWQGHVDQGEGFRLALEHMERCFAE